MGLCSSKLPQNVRAVTFVRQDSSDNALITTIVSPTASEINYASKQARFFAERGLQRIPIAGIETITRSGGVTKIDRDYSLPKPCFASIEQLGLRS